MSPVRYVQLEKLAVALTRIRVESRWTFCRLSEQGLHRDAGVYVDRTNKARKIVDRINARVRHERMRRAVWRNDAARFDPRPYWNGEAISEKESPLARQAELARARMTLRAANV